jgi:hypothetical protein
MGPSPPSYAQIYLKRSVKMVKTINPASLPPDALLKIRSFRSTLKFSASVALTREALLSACLQEEGYYPQEEHCTADTLFIRFLTPVPPRPPPHPTPQVPSTLTPLHPPPRLNFAETRLDRPHQGDPHPRRRRHESRILLALPLRLANKRLQRLAVVGLLLLLPRALDGRRPQPAPRRRPPRPRRRRAPGRCLSRFLFYFYLFSQALLPPM